MVSKNIYIICSVDFHALGNVTKLIYVNLRGLQLAPWDNLLAILVKGECLCFIRFLPWQKRKPDRVRIAPGALVCFDVPLSRRQILNKRRPLKGCHFALHTRLHTDNHHSWGYTVRNFGAIRHTKSIYEQRSLLPKALVGFWFQSCKARGALLSWPARRSHVYTKQIRTRAVRTFADGKGASAKHAKMQIMWISPRFCYWWTSRWAKNNSYIDIDHCKPTPLTFSNIVCSACDLRVWGVLHALSQSTKFARKHAHIRTRTYTLKASAQTWWDLTEIWICIHASRKSSFKESCFQSRPSAPSSKASWTFAKVFCSHGLNQSWSRTLNTSAGWPAEINESRMLKNIQVCTPRCSTWPSDLQAGFHSLGWRPWSSMYISKRNQSGN